MVEMPSKQQLILLVNSLCQIQDKISPPNGVKDDLKRSISAKFEPLKAPLFFVWELLGYGSASDLSHRGVDRYALASCKASPLQYMSECARKLRTFEIPINEYDSGLNLRQSLMNFYSDFIEMYEDY
ncbi:MAG: hypothetical protein IJT51_07470 [Bacteroidales bacterium]|nr:hypothetical protein [Bacteroidales bacterium]